MAKAETVVNPNEVVIQLDTPLVRGEQRVDSLSLRKPLSGELRGVSLIELVQMDVLALRKVLPRISSPILSEPEVNNMDPADLLACGVAIAGFLLQKSAKDPALAV
ncbi:phage tail assembly protein [Pseudomonas sp. 5P_3.1_Bac2]|uniref:phage tail assembly protein n=1 Tax=Pseudomonas sp. 5P_3.1_Bac2 TaxID=2971617 RepID=UPI0021CA16D2|nr:phage tail assembly protein [Pseudomonas sp. 5P_3.1_Bac2]MCU1717434.1 phage tail assembly protein [Pseudomonas sp. 5P_3.1_Bac2]